MNQSNWQKVVFPKTSGYDAGYQYARGPDDSHMSEQQRELAEAEAWGKMADSIHSFNSDDTNMWYDRPQENGKRDGRVVDISYNSGLIERKISSTGKTIYIGKKAKGETLINSFRRRSQGKL